MRTIFVDDEERKFFTEYGVRTTWVNVFGKETLAKQYGSAHMSPEGADIIARLPWHRMQGDYAYRIKVTLKGNPQ